MVKEATRPSTSDVLNHRNIFRARVQGRREASVRVLAAILWGRRRLRSVQLLRTWVENVAYRRASLLQARMAFSMEEADTAVRKEQAGTTARALWARKQTADRERVLLKCIRQWLAGARKATVVLGGHRRLLAGVLGRYAGLAVLHAERHGVLLWQQNMLDENPAWVVAAGGDSTRTVERWRDLILGPSRIAQNQVPQPASSLEYA